MIGLADLVYSHEYNLNSVIVYYNSLASHTPQLKKERVVCKASCSSGMQLLEELHYSCVNLHNKANHVTTLLPQNVNLCHTSHACSCGNKINIYDVMLITLNGDLIGRAPNTCAGTTCCMCGHRTLFVLIEGCG